MLNDYCDVAERQSELCLSTKLLSAFSSDSGLRPHPRRFLTHGAASKNTGEFKHRRGQTSPYRPAVPGLHTLLDYRNAAFISTRPKHNRGQRSPTGTAVSVMAAVAGNTQYRTNSCNNVNINRDRVSVRRTGSAPQPATIYIYSVKEQ